MRAATNPGGPGHAWMKERFIPDDYLRAKSADRFGRCWWNRGRLFVPARLQDNPHVDQDTYRSGLAKLDPVTRAQLEDGDMKAHTGGRFQEGWFRRYRDLGDAFQLMPHGAVVHRSACVVGRQRRPRRGTSDGADYTAIVVGAITPARDLLILDVVREHVAIEGIVPRLAGVCLQWQPSFVLMEGGFNQSALIRQARATRGIPAVQEVNPEGKSKLTRAIPAIIRAEAGQIYLPERRGPWEEAYLAELCSFTGERARGRHRRHGGRDCLPRPRRGLAPRLTPPAARRSSGGGPARERCQGPDADARVQPGGPAWAIWTAPRPNSSPGRATRVTSPIGSPSNRTASASNPSVTASQSRPARKLAEVPQQGQGLGKVPAEG